MRVAPGLGVFALVVAVAACDGDGTEDASTTENGSTASAVAVFDPTTDDLCEWVTSDEVVEMLTASGADVEAPATPSQANVYDATGWDCAWMLASGEELQLGARSYVGHRSEIPDNYEGTEQVMDPGGVPVAGHPELSDGVIVENQAFGRFSFFVVDTDHQLNVLYESQTGFYGSEEFETVLMSTADAVLAELGWLTS